MTSQENETQWTTVAAEEPTRVVFDTFGDQWEGVYRGMDTVTPSNGKEPWDVLLFTGDDGDTYSFSPSFKLRRVFEDIEPGTRCRMTYIKDIPTARNQNPMKDIRVETAS